MTKTLLITGMSGAGKTQVMRTLEDLGYFCVDNLPPTFIPKFIELCMKKQDDSDKLALAVDTRGGKFFGAFDEVLDQLTSEKIPYELLFLDADESTLIRRYKETRRRHPLNGKNGLSADISQEREILRKVRTRATTIIDTSKTTTKQLRNRIISLYGTNGSLPAMTIVVQSFGFKFGLPLDCDMVFDVRFLPNPFYDPALKEQCGNDPAVVSFLQEKPVTGKFEKKLYDLIQFLLPQYVQEGKSQLMIGVGCTGGRHRSVYIANSLGKFIESCGYKAKVMHRDLMKK